jgi:hypothetical protein
MDQYPSITVPAGTVMYSGSSEKTNRCPLSYKYKGQTGNHGSLLYLSSDETAAEGYALCNGRKSGWVKKYKVIADLELLDISEDQTQYEWDEVMNLICNHKNGYYLDWGGTIEYTVCKPSKFLKLMETKRCIGHQKFSAYTCKLNHGRRRITLKKRLKS